MSTYPEHLYPGCPCYTCDSPNWTSVAGIPCARMTLCPECGSKRCPGAFDHTRHGESSPTEILETGIAHAVHEIDELRAENERLLDMLNRANAAEAKVLAHLGLVRQLTHDHLIGDDQAANALGRAFLTAIGDLR